MTDRNGSRAGNRIASMTVKTPVNFEDHSGTLTDYIPTDDEDSDGEHHDPRLVLRSNWDGGVPETVLSEAGLVAAVAMLEYVPDDQLPDRTPVGTLMQLHAWAREAAERVKRLVKQKS